MELSNSIDTMIRIPSAGLPLSAHTAPAVEAKFNCWHSWKVIDGATPNTYTSTVKVDIGDLREFRERAAKIDSRVYAILVEPGEGEERHITTFLTEPDAEVERQIYELEAEIIDKYQDRIFDFHLRTITRDDNGRPLLPCASIYFMLTWETPSHGNR